MARIKLLLVCSSISLVAMACGEATPSTGGTTTTTTPTFEATPSTGGTTTTTTPTFEATPSTGGTTTTTTPTVGATATGLDLSDLTVGIALRDIDASDLVDSAAGGVFAINNRLDAVTLYELNAVDSGSGIEVLDRSAEIAPPWGTFAGSEMGSVGHGRSGSNHVLVIVENQVSGQILTASSTDDGATWTTAFSADTRCGSHDQRTYIIGGSTGSVSYEACDSGTPGLLWQAPLGGGIELTGGQLPAFNYTDTMCSTDEVGVHLHDEYDSDAAGSFYSLWTSADGLTWGQIEVPGGFGTPQPLDQKWLSCTGAGFIAAAESSGWQFAADGSFIGQFDTPEGADRFSTSHGYLFAWSSGMPLQASDDGGATWYQVAGTLGDITDAAASADGHIWVLSDGGLYSTASAASASDLEESALAFATAWAAGDAGEIEALSSPDVAQALTSSWAWQVESRPSSSDLDLLECPTGDTGSGSECRLPSCCSSGYWITLEERSAGFVITDIWLGGE